MTAGAQQAGASLERLLDVIRQLREHCPWMGTLTHESLAEYLVEECYELLEALEGPADTDELRSELGDVLLQVVLHARLQEERGSFAMAEVIDGLTHKMIRRNAHIFTPDGGLRDVSISSIEEIEASWLAIKRQEQPADTTPFASIPPGLPALASAAKTLKRARRDRGAQRDGGPARGAGTAVVPGEKVGTASEEELGEGLLAVVGRAVDAGLDPERALRLAVRRYQQEHLAQ
ncbi:MazG nucleotide pyrophosphohydrolase domain-containing protein [uncultured Arthrobacter sp.]|uniref:MazG nucleotide pyrophosphohydrolase domain-containing protein n=1 Tax=uncultured Arthrobacter sp. TaxID=114050 RepID=UPI002637C2C6|nr:MazG nucleotide pyrophosphohydrolase domain-containing protein [uncultured Arthrobacter sp.]